MENEIQNSVAYAIAFWVENGRKRHGFQKISKNNHHPKGQELSNQRNSMKKLTGGSECKVNEYLLRVSTSYLPSD